MNPGYTERLMEEALAPLRAEVEALEAQGAPGKSTLDVARENYAAANAAVIQAENAFRDAGTLFDQALTHRLQMEAQLIAAEEQEHIEVATETSIARVREELLRKIDGHGCEGCYHPGLSCGAHTDGEET